MGNTKKQLLLGTWFRKQYLNWPSVLTNLSNCKSFRQDSKNDMTYRHVFYYLSLTPFPKSYGRKPPSSKTCEL